MKHIEILNNKFDRLCFMDNSVPDALHYYNDALKTSIEGGVYTLEFSSPKTSRNAQHLKEGHYITFFNNQGRRIFMQIRSVDDFGGKEKRVSCEDVALTLANSFAEPIAKPTAGQTIDYYLNFLLRDTGFSIGINECDGKAFLEFTDINRSILARIREVMVPFQMQFYFSAELIDRKPKFFINIVKRRLEGEPGFRLSSDDVLVHIERRVNVNNIITRLVVRGAEVKDGEKVTKAGTATQNVPTANNTSGTSGKTAKFIQWFKDREGKVGYSQSARTGPNYYDCSSAVYFALLHAGYIQPSSWPYTTETLYSLEGKLLTPISFNQAQPGDIFVAGVKGASAGDYGHTGVYLGNNQIIHCTATRNGIVTTPVNGWTGSPVHWYRLRG